MSQILLNTRGLILDDETGNSFKIGDVLSYIKYKKNNTLYVLYEAYVKCIDSRCICVSINNQYIKIKIDNIISWN